MKLQSEMETEAPSLVVVTLMGVQSLAEIPVLMVGSSQMESSRAGVMIQKTAAWKAIFLMWLDKMQFHNLQMLA